MMSSGGLLFSPDMAVFRLPDEGSELVLFIDWEDADAAAQSGAGLQASFGSPDFPTWRARAWDSEVDTLPDAAPYMESPDLVMKIVSVTSSSAVSRQFVTGAAHPGPYYISPFTNDGTDPPAFSLSLVQQPFEQEIPETDGEDPPPGSDDPEDTEDGGSSDSFSLLLLGGAAIVGGAFIGALVTRRRSPSEEPDVVGPTAKLPRQGLPSATLRELSKAHQARRQATPDDIHRQPRTMNTKVLSVRTTRTTPMNAAKPIPLPMSPRTSASVAASVVATAASPPEVSSSHSRPGISLPVPEPTSARSSSSKSPGGPPPGWVPPQLRNTKQVIAPDNPLAASLAELDSPSRGQ